jgi:hypothetical protein
MTQPERIVEVAATFVVALLDSPTGRELATMGPDARAALSVLWNELDQGGHLDEWRKQHWSAGSDHDAQSDLVNGTTLLGTFLKGSKWI